MAEATLESEIARRGEAQERDRDLILLLALIARRDILLAIQLWDALMPPRWKGLLEAQAFENVRDEDDLPLVWFDIRTQRYGLGNRGFITQPALFQAIDTFREKAAERMRESVVPMYEGAIEIGQWQEAREQDLKLITIAVVAVALGGVSQLNQAAQASASKSLTYHLERLTKFAEQIEEGFVMFEAARRRAALYPASIVAENFDSNRRDSAIAAGFKEEINVLADSEHCETTPVTAGCADLTELGWVDIGTLPPPGKRTCSMNCKCHLQFRRSEAETN